jgi:plastocyanin
MQRRFLMLIAIAALIVGLAACGSSSKNSAPAGLGPAQITIVSASGSGFAFQTTPVKAGSTVTIKNQTDTQHTVTQDSGGGFDVSIDGGQTAKFTAPAASGTYPFHCKIHSFMHGTLTVT